MEENFQPVFKMIDHINEIEVIVEDVTKSHLVKQRYEKEQDVTLKKITRRTGINNVAISIEEFIKTNTGMVPVHNTIVLYEAIGT
ncbi:hypothetical protein KC901_00345 [Patescibacteria group bacterium]|nr:hypothetical protein [Patescibacteria group bacterium]